MDIWAKSKKHFKKYQPAYLIAGTTIVVAGITVVIMKGRYEALVNDGAYGSKTMDNLITVRSFSFSSPNNIVNVVSRNGRGHPGYIIKNIDTNTFFSSQREAAKAFDISETILSKHLNGIISDANGLLFDRLMLSE